ncbi:MAG: aminodeoxychorismate synthase component I [Bacteroidales bacterium]|nr:aminodeoxychorismate synthase component I [Bacteroidales bacterium]
MDKNTAILRMNELGKRRVPFLFIIDYTLQNNLIFPLDKIPSNIHFEIHSKSEMKTNSSIIELIEPIQYPDFKEYNNSFDYIKNQIKLGNTYVANLTFSTKIKLHKTMNEIYTLSNAKYKLMIDDSILVFSPECFVKIENGTISTFPMKGTKLVTNGNSETELINNFKEIAEHSTVVDLLRNDLNKVSKSVEVERFKYIDKIKTNSKELLQLSSKITGKLNENYEDSIGTLIYSMLPAGSICGAPKQKTLEIIEKAETHERGFYTGIFGVFDGENLDSAVLIRFIEKKGEEYFYKSGGGITWFSDCLTEYEELKTKIYVPIG